MDTIAKNVYIEERYLGVTLGVIVQPRGLVQIDAPIFRGRRRVDLYQPARLDDHA